MCFTIKRFCCCYYKNTLNTPRQDCNFQFQLFAVTMTYYVKVTGSTLFADTVTYYKVKVTGSTLWGKAHQGCCTTGMETLTLMTPKSPRKLQCWSLRHKSTHSLNLIIQTYWHFSLDVKNHTHRQTNKCTNTHKQIHKQKEEVKKKKKWQLASKDRVSADILPGSSGWISLSGW